MKSKQRKRVGALIEVYSSQDFQKRPRALWTALKREGILAIQTETPGRKYLVSARLWSPAKLKGDSDSILTITRYGKPVAHLVSGGLIVALIGSLVPFTKAGLRLIPKLHAVSQSKQAGWGVRLLSNETPLPAQTRVQKVATQ